LRISTAEACGSRARERDTRQRSMAIECFIFPSQKTGPVSTRVLSLGQAKQAQDTTGMPNLSNEEGTHEAPRDDASDAPTWHQ